MVVESSEENVNDGVSVTSSTAEASSEGQNKEENVLMTVEEDFDEGRGGGDHVDELEGERLGFEQGEEYSEEIEIGGLSPLFVRAMIQLVDSAEAYAVAQPMFAKARQDTISAQLKKKVFAIVLTCHLLLI